MVIRRVEAGDFAQWYRMRGKDGCRTRNVGYIEGWYVEAAHRRQGVGAALVRAAEEWARAQGCQEMASDCFEDNAVSLASHLALGYTEKERLIHFAKEL